MYKKTNWPRVFNQLWCLFVAFITLFGGGCLLYQQTLISLYYFLFSLILAIALYLATKTAPQDDRWLGLIQFFSAINLYSLLWSIHKNLNTQPVDGLLLKIDMWLDYYLPINLLMIDNYWLSEFFSFCYLAYYIILFSCITYYGGQSSNIRTKCFFHGLMLLYFSGVILHIALPAIGPLHAFSIQFSSTLPKGKITSFLITLINYFDIGLTAFPAMPCAITFYLLGYFFIFHKYNITLFLLIFFILLCLSCTFLHFFYMLSIFVGILQATFVLLYLCKILGNMYS